MKRGFSLIELIFVIMIIGILSAVLIPRFNRSTLNEAANQVVSHIRYTQHLAMVDNKFDPNDRNWYKRRWQIIFTHSKNNSGQDTDGEWAYTIFSDKPNYSGDPDISEMAKNPQNTAQFLSGGYSGTLDWEDSRATRSMNLGKKYGITNVTFTHCGAQRMAFDYLGRPISGNLRTSNRPYQNGRVLSIPCDITLSDGITNKIIRIEPETGYAHIL